MALTEVTSATPADELGIGLDVKVGAELDGAGGRVWGQDLKAGTLVILTVHSTPIEVARFITTNGGTFSGDFLLPSGLEDGSHRVVATATSPDGEPTMGEYTFKVMDNKITELAPVPAGYETFVKASPFTAYAEFRPADDPASTLDMQTQLFAIASLAAGAAAVQSSMGGRNGRNKQSGDRASVGSRASSRTERESAELPALMAWWHDFGAERRGFGDRSRTWRLPGTARIDAMSTTVPTSINRFSPMVARAFSDGTYLRAMFGTAWLFVPVIGALMGVGAGLDANGTFLPPALAWVVALTILGAVDAFAGGAAAVAYVATTVALGGMPNRDGAQSTAGLVALWFAPVMVGSIIRPLRRMPARSAMGRWDRFTDGVLIAFFGMWCAQGIVWAQNGLSGRELPITESADLIGFIVLAALFVRFLVETFASSAYPDRLVATDCGELDDPSMVQITLALIGSLALYGIVAASFFPVGWQLWACLGLGAVTAFTEFDLIRDHIPNSELVHRLIPSRLGKTVVLILMGRAIEQMLTMWQKDPDRQVLDGLVYLSIPSLLMFIFMMIGRDGERPEPRWWHKVVGVAVFAALVHLTVGWI